MATISISRDEVLADMKVKSHAEVASIPDATQRYLAELGTEKEPEAHQCINDAAAEVAALLRPLDGTFTGSATDDYDASSDLSFSIDVTSRKPIATPLTKAVHAYIVDSALAKFYVAVSRPELAERHNGRMALDMATINRLLYTKNNPTIRTSIFS